MNKLTLHLGVIDQPYRSASKKASAMTTGDVAQILEEKYGLFSGFYRVHEADIAKAVENSLAGALDSLISGKVIDPWDGATKEIQTAFKDFISSREAENIGLPGTPTKAALRGVNHRYKHPYRKSNPRRPSFRDTGTMAGSFFAWVD